MEVAPVVVDQRSQGTDFEVTFEPLEDPLVEALPEKVKKRLPELHFAMGIDARLVEEEVKYYSILYPEIAMFQNWLAKCLHEGGRREEARALAERTMRRHPDYFSGILLAGQFAFWDGDLERVDELLGTPKTPRSLAPERDVFHVSEVVGYYYLCGQFSLRKEQWESALICLEIMEELAPDQEITQDFGKLCKSIMTGHLALAHFLNKPLF